MSTYDTNIPGAVGTNGYANQALAANTAYKNTLAQINQKRMASLRQAGYLGDVDPTSGVLSNIRVDPNNPYGGLQSMFRGQAGDFRNAQWAAEDRGLRGGLAHKADSELAYQHGAQAAQFGSDFANTLGGFQQDQNQAAYTRDSSLADAEWQAAQEAILNQNFNPGDYTGIQDPGYGTDPLATPTATTPPHTTAPSSRATALATKVLAQAQKKVVASPVSRASQAAAVTARKAGASQAARALAERSAGLNAKYKKGGK